jgi:hypothetical protein
MREFPLERPPLPSFRTASGLGLKGWLIKGLHSTYSSVVRCDQALDELIELGRVLSRPPPPPKDDEEKA